MLFVAYLLYISWALLPFQLGYVRPPSEIDAVDQPNYTVELGKAAAKKKMIMEPSLAEFLTKPPQTCPKTLGWSVEQDSTKTLRWSVERYSTKTPRWSVERYTPKTLGWSVEQEKLNLTTPYKFIPSVASQISLSFILYSQNSIIILWPYYFQKRNSSKKSLMYKKGKWDVLGSPSKPVATRNNILSMQNIGKRVSQRLFFPNFVIDLCSAWGRVLEITKSEFQHSKIAYAAPLRDDQYKRDTVAGFPFNRMHHALSLSKILPSFNVGIILALIWCFRISCKKGEKCAGGETGEKEVRCPQRGSTMLFILECIKCAIYTMIYYKKKRSTDVQISVRPHTDGSPVNSPSVHTKVKKSSKCSHDYSHVYDLRQFFESCTVTFSSPSCVS